MKEVINNELLLKRDIIIENEEMPNGETRFRVRWNDFSGVNMTTSGNSPNWQNAHYHKYAKEVYIVQKGKILIAIEENEKIHFKQIKKGEYTVIDPYVKHNVYMYKDTMTFCIKCGDTVKKDWFAAVELDKISREYKV